MRRALFCAALAAAVAAALSCAHQKTVVIEPNPSGAVADARGPCQTRYPLLLVHGYSWKDGFPLKGYWGKIPEALRDCGAEVFLANHDALASMDDKARALDARLRDVLAETGAAKVNIIAHSTGGLESRVLISSLGRGDRVASLTTMATPHRGTRMAAYLIRQKSLVGGRSAGLMELASIFLLGDLSPGALQSLGQLSPEGAQAFNEANPDDPRVSYQSWAAKLDSSYPAVPYLIAWEILRDMDGPNDGFVTVESAQWGDFRGIVGAEHDLPVSHSDIHGLNLFPAANRFDAPAFYRGIVKELKDRGF